MERNLIRGTEMDSRDGEELVSNHARGTREKESEASRTVSLKPNPYHYQLFLSRSFMCMVR